MNLLDANTLRYCCNPCVTLRVTSPASAGTEHRLFSFPVIVGRGDGADVLVDDQLASRLHCLLEFCDRELFVFDLGSRNGTWVNGDRVSHASLAVDDELRVGETCYSVSTIIPDSVVGGE